MGMGCAHRPAKRSRAWSIGSPETFGRGGEVVRSNEGGGYTIEGDLRREVGLNIRRLMDIGSYRGLRHRHSLTLPVYGQYSLFSLLLSISLRPQLR